jgi:hypothetical protein
MPGKGKENAGSHAERGENVVAMVPGDGLHGEAVGHPPGATGLEHQKKLGGHRAGGRPQRERGDGRGRLLSFDQIEKGIDGVPKNRQAARDDEGADHESGDRFVLMMAVGMFAVGRLARHPDEEFDHQEVDDV